MVSRYEGEVVDDLFGNPLHTNGISRRSMESGVSGMRARFLQYRLRNGKPTPWRSSTTVAFPNRRDA